MAITQGARRAAVVFGVSQEIAEQIGTLCGSDIAGVAERAAEQTPWCLRLSLTPAEEATLSAFMRHAALPEQRQPRHKAEAERLAGLTLSLGRARARKSGAGDRHV